MHARPCTWVSCKVAIEFVQRTRTGVVMERAPSGLGPDGFRDGGAEGRTPGLLLQENEAPCTLGTAGAQRHVCGPAMINSVGSAPVVYVLRCKNGPRSVRSHAASVWGGAWSCYV